MIDIRFDGVSKRYRIRRPAAAGEAPTPGDFWAVRDVTFEVPHGETLGIIGPNGAGKSTVLKLLSRITAPSAGTITLDGRVAALIEVGSGFHPELTGRENIFLSGSILGMKRREIAAKLERIIEFSGVGSFIDVPVKWYSSGMYVRLGFAIAAHLEADILLVDEVLAVGDAAFQLQCYERIGELRRQGTTMLFISHDLTSVDRLCDRVLLMNAGVIAAAGSPRDVIRAYDQMTDDNSAGRLADAAHVAMPGAARVVDVTFRNEHGEEVRGTRTGGPLCARVDIDVLSPIADAVVEVFYYSRDGRTLHCQQTTALTPEMLPLWEGRRSLEFTCPEMGLQPGVYAVGASVRDRTSAAALDWWYGTRLLMIEPGKNVRGYFYAPHSWRWADVAERQRHSADV
ncbi:MAG TPA: ABC transporter ATP-binding protein [Vicinamibacterales bacterium]|jgi:ABC-type polysaccharide/polyol phosphate transport system ATPase subunit|nr:ABC transporter ATP-binding protein [Vicinamibacterales bacterium]